VDIMTLALEVINLVKHHLPCTLVDDKISALRKHYLLYYQCLFIDDRVFTIEECYSGATGMPLARRNVTNSLTYSEPSF
jgi:hypothetical protein